MMTCGRGSTCRSSRCRSRSRRRPAPCPRRAPRRGSTRSSRTVSSAATESAASVSVPISSTSPSETVGVGRRRLRAVRRPRSTGLAALDLDGRLPGRRVLGCRGHRFDAVAVVEHLDGVGDVLLGHDDVHRAARARGEVLGEHLLTVARLGAPEHEVARRHAVRFELQQRRTRRPAARRCRRSTPARAWRATKRACRGQKPLTGWVRSSGSVAMPLLRDERPEGRLPKRASSAGRKVSADSTENAMPIEAIGPSARLVARSDSSRQSSPAMTVPPDAMIGSNAPRQAGVVASHRRAPVADRLAEARDVEQRVVGRGADHEDEEDALHLPVEHDDAGVRQPPHRQQRHAQREHRGQQHQDRQQRRSVDDHEDDEDRDAARRRAAVRRCRGSPRRGRR